jgi:hypothetical protein
MSSSARNRVMTEQEWLACADPEPMLKFLKGRASHRKLRLFACGCWRLEWHLVTEQDQQRAVEVAERYADGIQGGTPLSVARQAAMGVACGSAATAAEYAAMQVVWRAVHGTRSGSWEHAVRGFVPPVVRGNVDLTDTGRGIQPGPALHRPPTLFAAA